MKSLDFGVKNSNCRDKGLGFTVWGLRFRVKALGFWIIHGLGFTVKPWAPSLLETFTLGGRLINLRRVLTKSSENLTLHVESGQAQ